ncbi:hypothetical protein QQP08_007776 [Theobroma cacao]|nr:hypothetical protein QQP08_007776 [Theobroma cacao]
MEENETCVNVTTKIFIRINRNLISTQPKDFSKFANFEENSECKFNMTGPVNLWRCLAAAIYHVQQEKGLNRTKIATDSTTAKGEAFQDPSSDSLEDTTGQ